MDSNSASDEEADTGPSLVTRAKNRVLLPLRPLVSKNALTAYVGGFLFFATAIFMIFVSVLAYGVFYYKFVPQVGLERTVHLQFGDAHPWGTATLDKGLISSQPYDVQVELELPRTPSNLAMGNFMLDLTLLSHASTSARTGENRIAPPISHSRRPAILTYASPLIDYSSKVSFLPLYILGWKREAERLVVRMMEGLEFSRGAHNIPETLLLELHSHEKMQVYSAKVRFRIRFTGVRWLMYQWRVPSFFVFTFMFWSVSMFSFSVSWVLLACFFDTKTITGVKVEEKGKARIKAEDESESESEPTIKDEPSDERLLEFDSGSDTSEKEVESDSDYDIDPTGQRYGQIMTPDSGSGTARERAEGSGLQRRRSITFKEEDS